MARGSIGAPAAGSPGPLALGAPRGLALALGAALAAALALRAPAAWWSGNSLNHVSGAWMALADDLARGTFYRPVLDPALGYGGTRFFPLAFALHAALVRAGLPLFPAGQLLALLEGLAAAAGAAWFLRCAGHPRWAAAALATLPLAGFSGQLAVAAVRGDLLATALSIWALGWLAARAPAGGRRAPARIAAAALLLVLAFLAKPTSLAAAAAGVAFLALRRERRATVGLAVAVCAGCAGAVAAVDLLSSGRFLALLAALGAGGAGAADLAHAPLRMVELLVREDPAGLALLAAGAVAAPQALRRARGGHAPVLLAALWMTTAAGATLATLASPGTGVNHLLDVEAAAALVAAAALAGSAPALARAAVALAAAAGVATAAAGWRRDLPPGRLAAARAALEAAGGPGMLLSEDPLLPLLAGERPYVLDPWMVRLASARDPEIARPLLERLRTGGFRAVVLLADDDGPGADEWFSRELGAAALREIRARWRPAATVGPYHVYRYADTGTDTGRPAEASAAPPR